MRLNGKEEATELGKGTLTKRKRQVWQRNRKDRGHREAKIEDCDRETGKEQSVWKNGKREEQKI